MPSLIREIAKIIVIIAIIAIMSNYTIAADDQKTENKRIPILKGKITLIPSITSTTGSGEIVIKPHKEKGKLSIHIISLAVPTVKGKFCLLCSEILKLSPNIKFPTNSFIDGMKIGNESLGPTFSIKNIFFTGSKIDPQNITEYLEAGSKGATLKKKGKGFLLIDGDAVWVTK